MAYTLTDFSEEKDITPEILEDFKGWYQRLMSWNRHINLVSKSALDEFWLRHALDSWQVTRHVPAEAKTIIDLGSGGGFPGLALAIAAKHNGHGQQVTLVESAGKKVNFLRTVIRELSLPATVKAVRVESLPPQNFDVISARAFAPLPELLAYANPFWGEGTTALLLKGQSAEEEMETARAKWTFSAETIASVSAQDGVLIKLHNLVLND